MSRSRKEWVIDEKGHLQSWMTIGELARYLGTTTRTIQRHVRTGAMPGPARRTPSGWGLWSPAQQIALLHQKVRLD